MAVGRRCVWLVRWAAPGAAKPHGVRRRAARFSARRRSPARPVAAGIALAGWAPGPAWRPVARCKPGAPQPRRSGPRSTWRASSATRVNPASGPRAPTSPPGAHPGHGQPGPPWLPTGSLGAPRARARAGGPCLPARQSGSRGRMVTLEGRAPGPAGPRAGRILRSAQGLGRTRGAIPGLEVRFG